MRFRDNRKPGAGRRSGESRRFGAQMRADEQTAIQAADKAEAAAKLVLQTKDRHEAFQLLDKVIEQTDIASEGDSAWFDQCLSAPRGSTRAAR